MLGDANPLNVVPQQAKVYNARCIKDELEVEAARTRGQSTGGGGGPTSDSTADKTPPAGGKAAGRGTRARKLPAANTP